MLKKTLLYGAGLIAVYLFVNNATGAGKDLGALQTFAVAETTALQGR